MNTINITLKVWRQRATDSKGDFETYEMEHINSHMSFLELLDVLNERLIKDDKDPIAFEHDCREGICGSCAMSINGEAHGPVKATTACQLHMFNFKDGDTITAEPWRAESFPILKDLFTNEFNDIKSYKPPAGYSFKVDNKIAQPNMMQKLTVNRLKKYGRYGNWSGTGAGKTLSFIIASREVDARLTVVVCLNSTISQLEEDILDVYPDSVVHGFNKNKVFGGL